MKKILSSLILFCTTALAQTPNLLKDINTGTLSSKFGQFAVLPTNDIVFQVLTPSVSSNGLWVSNGSTVGTKKLRTMPILNSPFCEYNGKLYFMANTPGHVLWRTDGTESGTDSIPNSSLISVSDFTICNNLLFFRGISNLYGKELWRTDGTVAGTYMVMDINPGASNAFAANTVQWYNTNYNGNFYFVANDGVNGYELWKTNGTTAGTSLLKDINPGLNSGNPIKPVVGNNGFYFIANHVTTGNELWFSDGSTANTYLIKDIATGTLSPILSEITFMSSMAYFHNGVTIFKTNGTPAGTSTLGIGGPMSQSIISQEIVDSKLTILNNELHFLFLRSAYPYFPLSIQKYDSMFFYKVDLNLGNKTVLNKIDFVNPTQSITMLYCDLQIVEGTSFIYGFVPNMFYSSVLIFNPAANHVKKYYDQKDLNASYLPEKYLFGNKLYFPYNAKKDSEPSYINLSNDSIYLLKNINPNGTCYFESPYVSTFHHEIFTLNNKHYFLANAPGTGLEFWETDFTSAGTNLVKDIFPGTSDYNYCNFCSITNGKVYGIVTPNNFFFAANDGVNGLELWSFINSPNPVGIKNQTLTEAAVQIFPNPGSEKVTIRSEEVLQEMVMVNAFGAVVKKETIASAIEAQFNVSELASGIYFITVKTTKGQTTHKFIKD